VGAGEDVAVEEDGLGWGALRVNIDSGEGGREEDCAESEGFHVVECIRRALVLYSPPPRYYAKSSILKG
jgi:hypothetical protein